MWNTTLIFSSILALVVFVNVVASQPDGNGGSPSTEYGPPRAPDTAYGPPKANKAPSTEYGPPSKTPTSAKSEVPAAEYGPPKGASAGAALDTMYGPPKSVSSPDTKYGPPSASDQMYGPPDFTPGEPLDHYTASASETESFSVIAYCNNTDLATNKQLVKDFYQNVFGDKRVDLLDRYVASDVVNHNPMEVDGREKLVKRLKGPFGQGPPTKIDFKRISAEEDLVWLHSRIPLPALNATYAVVDIFRINCAGMIQERWDVMQEISGKSENPHAFF